MVRSEIVHTVLAGVTFGLQPSSLITILKPFVGGSNSASIKRSSDLKSSDRVAISERNGAIRKFAETPLSVLV
jgi:hypothetical protein